MGQRRMSRCAFTLIEVLVVVAIIALLVAILLPSLNKAREISRMTVCQSNMRQVSIGLGIYTQEMRALPMTHSVPYTQSPRFWPIPARVTWDGAAAGAATPPGPYGYAPYYNNTRFLREVPQTGTIYRYVRQEKVYLCPSDKPGKATDTITGGVATGGSAIP